MTLETRARGPFVWSGRDRAIPATAMRCSITSAVAPSAHFLRAEIPLNGLMRGGRPGALKKLTRNVGPSIRNAEARATNTPDLPLPAMCGLPERDPMAHAIAEIATPATDATSPNVSRAPTTGPWESTAGAACAVRLDVHVGDEHVDCPSRPPGGLPPPTQRLPAGRYTVRCVGSSTASGRRPASSWTMDEPALGPRRRPRRPEQRHAPAPKVDRRHRP
jgi:hypothetical protein